MILAAILAIAAANAPVPSNTPADICMRAAAVVAHASVKESDRQGCVCADQQLHKLLRGGDYALHEDMQAIIASGADEKSFNKQLSDAMLQRRMNQADADQFFARLKAAEATAQQACNTSPLLGRPLSPQPQ
ncbi:MAG: hypothetical protein WBQ17_14385 [Rhizomicrobium sp.]